MQQTADHIVIWARSVRSSNDPLRFLSICFYTVEKNFNSEGLSV